METTGQKFSEMSVTEVANLVAKSIDADVIYFVGPINRRQGMELIEVCIKRRK